jgi:SAM-dependent methyltransferase
VSTRSAAEERVRLSHGISGEEVCRLAAALIHQHHHAGGLLLDIGCGTGVLRAAIGDHITRYTGVDICLYSRFPTDVEFHCVDLNRERVPLDDGSVDVLTALGVIEFLENPYGLMREIKRLTRPGGLILLSTPNQLSWLSKWTLLLRNRFNAFQRGPGTPMIMALLVGDLVRMAQESGFTDIQIKYTDHGRIPFTTCRWPGRLGFRGRRFSDTVILMARRGTL